MIFTLTDPAECERAWRMLSPGRRAWDDWDLMYAFHDQDGYRFHFLLHQTHGVADGLVPLVQDLSDQSFELFGGSYPDSRELWLRYDHFPLVFEALPEPTVFFDLSGPWVDGLLGVHPGFAENFAEQDLRYYLVPADFGFDFHNHVQTFSGEKRKGFLYDLRKIRERQPELRWSEDDESELFIELCNRSFGAESDYASEKGQAELRRVVAELRESGWLRTLTVTLDGRKEAVSMSALYGGTWIAMYAASNREQKNAGKLLNFETIQEACRQGVNEINYMTGMAWKAAWEMSAEPCRTMRKPPRAAPVKADSA